MADQFRALQLKAVIGTSESFPGPESARSLIESAWRAHSHGIRCRRDKCDRSYASLRRLSGVLEEPSWSKLYRLRERGGAVF